MKTLENTIKNTLKNSSNELLISKMVETLGDMKLATLNVAIQGELENRIGEDAVGDIIEANI